MKIDHLISVSTKRDLDIFKYSSYYIRKFIKSDCYEIIVPETDVELFKNIDSSWNVTSESTIPFFNLKYVNKKRNKGDNIHWRSGWYYQQLLKLNGLHQAALNNKNNLLIWDSDTIPFMPIDFFDVNGPLKFAYSKENHVWYFKTIKKILNLEKNTPFSYIAQNFPCKSLHIKEFMNFLEKTHHKPWYDAIMDNIIEKVEEDGNIKNSNSCFSEYETLGTFIKHFYSSDVTFMDYKWQRNGWNLSNLNEIEDFIENKNHTNVRYASFESWQKTR